MKKAAGYVLGFTAVVIGFCSLNITADAQPKIVEQKEFISAYQASLSLANNSPMRSELVAETFRDGILARTEIDIMLRDRSGHVNRLLIIKEAGQQTESEKRFIGDKIYSRNNNSPWQVEQRSTELVTGVGAAGSAYSCDQMTVEEVFLDNNNAKLFHRINFERKPDGLDLTENKNWFGFDGMLLRTETIKGKYLPRIVNERIVRTYEYNISETVTAPAM